MHIPLCAGKLLSAVLALLTLSPVLLIILLLFPLILGLLFTILVHNSFPPYGDRITPWV